MVLFQIIFRQPHVSWHFSLRSETSSSARAPSGNRECRSYGEWDPSGTGIDSIRQFPQIRLFWVYTKHCTWDIWPPGFSISYADTPVRYIETQNAADLRGSTSLPLRCCSRPPITKQDIMRKHIAWMTTLPIAVQCGDVLWSGIFNSSASVADFDKCASVPLEHTSVDFC